MYIHNVDVDNVEFSNVSHTEVKLENTDYDYRNVFQFRKCVLISVPMLNKNTYKIMIYQITSENNIYCMMICSNEQTFIIKSITIYINRWKLIFIHKTCLCVHA